MKRLGILLGCLILIGCFRKEGGSSTILLLVKSQDNPFFQEIINGARDELKGRGGLILDVRSGQKEGDVSTQRQILQEYISRYIESGRAGELKGILVTPSGSNDELTSYIKKFNEAHVPVGIIDTRINGGALKRSGAYYDFFIGSSNRQGGELAAKVILSCQGGGGDVLLLNGVDGHETAAERRLGFTSALVGNYRLSERTCNWRRDEARAAMDGLLSLGRKFDAVFAANDEMALGVVEALRQNPRAPKPKVIVGFDAIDEARKAVGEHQMTATIAQDPIGMGHSAIKSLQAVNSGKAALKEQLIPVKVETVDECARLKN